VCRRCRFQNTDVLMDTSQGVSTVTQSILYARSCLCPPGLAQASQSNTSTDTPSSAHSECLIYPCLELFQEFETVSRPFMAGFQVRRRHNACVEVSSVISSTSPTQLVLQCALALVALKLSCWSFFFIEAHLQKNVY
jgi:hypothetical protein